MDKNGVLVNVYNRTTQYTYIGSHGMEFVNVIAVLSVSEQSDYVCFSEEPFCARYSR